MFNIIKTHPKNNNGNGSADAMMEEDTFLLQDGLDDSHMNQSSPASPQAIAGLEVRVTELDGKLAEAEAKLAEAEDKLAQSQSSLESFKQMVEDMPVNVMTCDLETLKIDYMNKSTRDTLGELEKLLPVPVDQLMGTCIDIFHENPSHQREILKDPKNLPHEARITLGEEILDLLVTAVRDGQGNYIGPMLTWKVVTEKVRADRESERLLQMIEGMPINVMTCDPETLEINYINQTSIDTLKTVQELLPVPAEELQGKCIDIFHKDPSHQRRLLGNPANLPHRAKIKLGEETLDLKVSAILSKEGEYIGPMLTWNVVTSQVNLANSFESNVKGVVDMVSKASGEMKSTAESMSATAEETNAQSTAVAAAAEEASTNVQTVAAATEELTNAITEISQQVNHSTGISQNAVSEAEKANETVNGLAEAANRIGEVVKLINDIASQTNLLALNATIEAARAGDAGKGFAVVANEVKSLANQTAKATEEIAAQIQSMQDATGMAVGAIEGISTTIGQLNQIATGIASAVEEQSAATEEIGRNIQQAADGTRDVSTNIVSVTEAAQKTGNAATDLLEAAGSMSEESSNLNQEVDNFLVEIRAL